MLNNERRFHMAHNVKCIEGKKWNYVCERERHWGKGIDTKRVANIQGRSYHTKVGEFGRTKTDPNTQLKFGTCFVNMFCVL